MHYYELLIAFSRFKGGFQGSVSRFRGGFVNLPFTLKSSCFFYIENRAKKMKIGIHKSGTGGGTVGQVVRIGKSTEKTMQAFYEC